MSNVDDLYRRYVREYSDAGDADPRPYLSELSGVERAELSLRIDRFLETTPAPVFDADAFARFRANPARQAMVERVLDPATLKSLREQLHLSKPQAAAELAEQLDLAGREAAVKARYHDLETGKTDPARIRPRVWEALSAIFKAPADRLREAAEAAFGGRQELGGATAFARSAPRFATGTTVNALRAHRPADADDADVDRAFFED